MNPTSLFLGSIFCIAGLLFSWGKLHIYLTAWQNLTQAEKAQIKIKPLCQNIGLMISASGIIFLLGGLSESFRNSYFVIAMVIWLISACVDVWYIGKNNRYQY